MSEHTRTALNRLASRVLALSLALALQVGCARDAAGPVSSAPRSGGTLVLGSISDVDSWNEYLARTDSTINLLRRIYLRLAQARGDSSEHPETFAPLLAESWQFADDGLGLTFNLRPARWSDGRPITSRDVRFTWQAQTSDEVPWIGASSKKHIVDVEAVDDRTVTFHFDRRYPFQLADAVDGGILPEHAFGKVPFPDWATNFDWSEIRVASGPFMLERHAPGQEIVLTRNPRYFREGYPRVDRVVVRIVPDVGNLVTQLLARDIDYVEGVSPREASGLSDRDGIELIEFNYPKYDYIGWNASRPPFDEPALRRAMTLAIDREALVEDLLYGYGRVSKGPLLSFWWSADRGLAPLPHDLGAARRALSELGYATIGADGTPSKTGRPLNFELLINNGNRLREQVAVKIQEQLSRIGVGVAIRRVQGKMLRQRAARGEYDAYVNGWVYSSARDLEMIFGSGFHPPKGLNVVFYGSDSVDESFAELNRVADWREMKPLLDSIQREIRTDQPYTFLYETTRLAVHGPRIAGVHVSIPSDPLAHLEQDWIR